MNFSDRFYFTSVGTVQVFKSENISCPHAFSTRLGGVSKDTPYASLNLSFGRGDDDANVHKNLEIFAKIFGSDRSHLVTASQVHSSNVRTVNADDAGKNFEGVDGFVTNQKGIILSASVADCTPILLEDRKNGVVAAIHAGWRGTAAAIAAEGVRKMVGLGADVKSINAAIGPCIHPCCYEVGEDFLDSVISLCGKNFAERHIRKDENGHLHADIASMNGEILLEAGLCIENISLSKKCTACESSLFFSHRASKGVRGTMKAAIML